MSSTLLAGALAVGAAWGSADDLGRAGRSFTQTCTVIDPDLGPVLMGSSRGPWPGSFYVVPITVALVVLTGLVALALRAIVTRPRPGLDSHALDTMLRRWSVGNVLTAATVTVLGTLGPLAVFMASAIFGGSCPNSAVETVVAGVALVIGPVAAGAAFALLASLVLTPSIRVDDLPPSRSGAAAALGAPLP